MPKRKTKAKQEPTPEDVAAWRQTQADMAANSRLASASAAEFYGYFRVPLRKYWHNLLGFDITAFDAEVVKSADDESMAAATTRKFGPAATALVTKLLA